MIVGSQNWSESGNDKNDENLLVFRNRSNGLRMAADYDDHFRNFLWPHAAKIEVKDISAGSTDASAQDAAN
jgi:phosphatidylserine/phosphatidylglycerophosphate/cardiolipin synthase-like enzyme